MLHKKEASTCLATGIFWFPCCCPCSPGLLLTLYKPLGDGKGRNPLVLTVLCLNVVALLPVLLGGDKELTLFTLSDTLPVTLRIDDTGRWVQRHHGLCMGCSGRLFL